MEPIYLDPKSLDDEIAIHERKIIKDASNISELMEQAGWKVLEEFIWSQIDLCKEKLVDEESQEKVMRLQQQVRSYHNVLGYARSLVNQAREIQQRADKASA